MGGFFIYSNMETTLIYVYVLFSRKFGRIYIGISGNPKNRLSEHNNGRNRSTKAYQPWEIILMEKYETREAARQREKYLKSSRGREKIRQMLSKKIG